MEARMLARASLMPAPGHPRRGRLPACPTPLAYRSTVLVHYSEPGHARAGTGRECAVGLTGTRAVRRLSVMVKRGGVPMGSEKASPQSVCATCTKPITPRAIVEYQHGSISHKACPVAASSNGG